MIHKARSRAATNERLSVGGMGFEREGEINRWGSKRWEKRESKRERKWAKVQYGSGQEGKD